MPKVEQKYSVKDEQELMSTIWDPQIKEVPRNFVEFVYPWGKKGTPLEFQRVRGWQAETLDEVGYQIKYNGNRTLNGLDPKMWQSADCSGRGIGKSSLVAWLSQWNVSCNIGSSTVITANTETQLKSRTWAEMGKWHTLMINGHWFERGSLTLKPAPWFVEAVKNDLAIDEGYYYVMGQTWSEEDPDAFAGLHNPFGVTLIFDEASGIPQSIHDVSEGFFTEPVIHRYWFQFSNGRRNSGAFYQCFRKNRDMWRTRHIDSRTVEGTDKEYLQKIVDKNGVDSYKARVEVLGKFPLAGDKQFISEKAVEAAKKREVVKDNGAPLIMGVDIARYGKDKSSIRFRKGRDARSIPGRLYAKKDNMFMAHEIASLADEYDVDAIHIDAGNGTGVIDRLRELGYKVTEVWFGAKTPSPEWANVRSEIWGKMRDWLDGGCIDDTQRLTDDLTAPEYGYKDKAGESAIQLESKDDMRERGEASPDDGDALAVTFYGHVSRTDTKRSRKNRGKKLRQVNGVDYDVYNYG